MWTIYFKVYQSYSGKLFWMPSGILFWFDSLFFFHYIWKACNVTKKQIKQSGLVYWHFTLHMNTSGLTSLEALLVSLICMEHWFVNFKRSYWSIEVQAAVQKINLAHHLPRNLTPPVLEVKMSHSYYCHTKEQRTILFGTDRMAIALLLDVKACHTYHVVCNFMTLYLNCAT